MLNVFDSKTRNGNGKGLVEYLENGTNNDRDIKDNRITLSGNLDILQRNINLAYEKNYKETYRNIVLSFDEDEMSVKDLKAISEKYINQYCVGYEKDEYVAYAEAHLPKTKFKEQVDENGEVKQVRRKPHIHITVSTYSPKLNKVLNFNNHARRLNDISLLCRGIEKEFGLSTPKQNPLENKRRVQSERTNIKDEITDYINQNIKDIKDFNQLKADIEKEFNTKIINQSKNAKVSSITILKDDKKIRIKGALFSEKGFLKAKDELIKPSPDNYKSKTKPTKDDIDYYKELEQKNEHIKAEIDKRETYSRNKAKVEEREFLKEASNSTGQDNYISYQAKLYKKLYNKTINYDLKSFYIRRRESDIVVQNKSKHIRVIDKGNKIHASGANTIEEVKIMLEMAKAKGWAIDKINAKGSDKFLKEFNKQREKALSKKDADVQEHSIIKETPRKTKGQAEQKNIDRTANETLNKTDLKELKKSLNPEQIFKKYNLKKEDYEVSKNQNDEYRIKVGTRNLSVIDFMYKELNIDIKEAIEIAQTLHADQTARPRPRYKANKERVYPSRTKQNPQKKKPQGLQNISDIETSTNQSNLSNIPNLSDNNKPLDTKSKQAPQKPKETQSLNKEYKDIDKGFKELKEQIRELEKTNNIPSSEESEKQTKKPKSRGSRER